MANNTLDNTLPSARDTRIDFFRGLALLAILANHIDLLNGTWYFKFSLKWLYPGFSDAAEVFVFLSGYVYGLVYFKHLLRNSLPGTYLKSLRRTAHLYVMNVLALVVVLGFVGLMKYFVDPGMTYPGATEWFFTDPAGTSLLAASLVYQPALFNVLPLYMVLLAIAPLVLVVARKSLLLTLGLSFSLYVIVQAWPTLNLPAFPFAESGGWAFNPFAWQFMFFLGLVMALGLKQGKFRIPHNRVLLAIAVTALQLALAPRLHFVLGKFGLVDAQWLHIPFLDKRNLGPLRLLHFFALGYVAYRMLPKGHWLYRSWFAKPIGWCGQHSLEVFSFGIVLTYLCYGVLSLIGSTSMSVHVITFAALFTTVAFATLLHGRKQLSRADLSGIPLTNQLKALWERA